MTTIDEAADRLAALYEEDASEIDLDKVVALVRIDLPGVQCYVEQTGGGCATIYLGQPYFLTEGQQLLPPGSNLELLGYIDHCIPVMGGPGWFTAPGWQKGRAHREDFSVGYECNDPVTVDLEHEWRWEVEGPVEPVIAAKMVQLYRDHPRRKAGEIP